MSFGVVSVMVTLVTMAGLDGYQTCRAIKHNKGKRATNPVVMVLRLPPCSHIFLARQGAFLKRGRFEN